MLSLHLVLNWKLLQAPHATTRKGGGESGGRCTPFLCILSFLAQLRSHVRRCPTQHFVISLQVIEPSPAQNVGEVFPHMRRLAGSMLPQLGAHHLVEGAGKLGDHSADIGASHRQRLVPQEGPEHGQGVALDDFGAPGINPCHKRCRKRDTNFLTTSLNANKDLPLVVILGVSLAKISEITERAP